MNRFWCKPAALVLSLSLVLSTVLAGPGIPAQAASEDQLADHVVINEVYGGGGNSGATYKNDFIELYNPTGSDIGLSGWSVQYGSAGSTGTAAFSNITALSGTIQSGHYFLIQEAKGSGGTTELPTPDLDATQGGSGIGLSGTGGQAALARTTDGVKGPNDSSVIDFVGWGAGAKQFEGSGAAPATTNPTSVSRTHVGVDTDDSKADFTAGAPTPQNSSAPKGPIRGESGTKDSSVSFNPLPDEDGFVDSGTPVHLSCGMPGAKIYYILNSNGEGSEYDDSRPLVINEDTTITAWVVSNGQEGPRRTQAYKASECISIADARSKARGASVTVKGVVTRSISGNLYIQDKTGGICVYLSGTAFTPASYPRGTSLTVKGTTDNFKGVIEVVPTSGGDITPDRNLPAKEASPDDITLADLMNGKDQGKLVRIKGVTLKDPAGSKSNYTISQNKISATLRDATDSMLSNFKANDVIDVVGIAGVYNTTDQLLVESQSDISLSGTPAPPSRNQVAAVTASPGNSTTAKAGDKVALACATQGATIRYSTNRDVKDSDYQTYDPNAKITLTALPVTIAAYATKDGVKQSEKAYFTYQAPFTGKYNIYFGQLHSHTTLSDGVGSVEDAFDHAAQVKNLDFLAVTDHSNYFESAADAASHRNTILDGSGSANWREGHQAADAITAKKVPNTDNPGDPNSTFLGVYGYEMTWSDGSGHINTFNTNGFEDRQNPAYHNKDQSASNPAGLDAYYKTLATVPDSISQFNHPGTTFGDFYDFADYSPTYDQLINMVEVGNGEGPIRGVGYFPSYEYYTRALDKGWHVAPTNNQDNHKGNWGDSNTARSVILAQNLSADSLYDAMRNHRIYATEDNDLSIRYSVDGAVMGSEITAAKGGNLAVHADLSDPTDKSIGKVEVIVNGGRVAAAQKVGSNKGSVDFTIPNNYSYYYLRVTEPDSDIAVTAPVWTSDVDKAGISSVTADTDLPVKGEPLKVTASLYNNENFNMTVSSLEFKVGDQAVRSVQGSDLANGAGLPSLGTNSYTFDYTPASAGAAAISVTMTAATEDGTPKTYTGALQLQVADPSAVTRVVIDGTHNNSYVSGYYSGNMGNVTKIAADDGTQVNVITDRNALTPDLLKNTQLLVVTAPATDPKYTPQTFGDDFISMVRNYVKCGGTAVVCGLSDYTNNNTDPYTVSTQLNNLLAGIGAKTTVSSDEVLDDVSSHNGGQSYRLYLQKYNMDSPYLKGVDPKQKYSFYSGCSVNPGEGAQWLVNGFDTTYSEKSSEKGNPIVKKKGDVCALAAENVGKGRVLVSGTVFLSDFEVKAVLDNNWDLPYANKTIVDNLLDSVRVDISTTSIADVRNRGKTGDVYKVEGTVTAGTEQPNAFTDTVYLQDSTGGINIYPVPNGSGIQVGQKLLVVGHVDAYQGDKELKIGSGVERYEVTDSSVFPVSPAVLSVAAASNYEKYGGSLARVTGTVSKITSLGGVVQNFTLSSGSGSIRVLINGYISPNVDLSGVVKNGAAVSVVGLIYMDPDGVCLRVRDRNEITPAGVSPTSDDSDDDHSPTTTDKREFRTNSTVTTADNGTAAVVTVTGRPDGPAALTGSRANLIITVPDSVMLGIRSATVQAPAEVRVVPSTEDILPQFDNGAVRTVGLNIRLPSQIAENADGRIKFSLSLPAALLNQAKATGKDLILSVSDTSGKELYSWNFSGSSLISSPISPPADLNLAVGLGTAAVDTPEAKVISENNAGGKGILLRFGGNGLLPSPAEVRLFVGNQPGITPNSAVYLYYYNQNAGQLESLPNNRHTVDAFGYVTIHIVHCSEYVLMPAAAAHPYPVKADTTYPVALKRGGSYTFSVSAASGAVPALNVGNGSVFTAMAVRRNDRCYITVKAIGKVGQGTALYSTLKGQKPVPLCYLFIKG